MGEMILLAGGFVALCVGLWLLTCWLGRTRSVVVARAEPVDAIAPGPSEAAGAVEPVPSGPVVLFKAHPPTEPVVVPAAKDVVAPGVVGGVADIARAGERAQEPVARTIARPEPDAVVAEPVRSRPLVVAIPEVAATEAVPGPPVRRRPRPAWELAVDGQTPASLLARAHEHLAAGAHEEAATQLRACARLASKLKDVAVEAVARLELGDLAQSHGDMTTACEHWQLARSLYTELKRADEATRAAKRMEKAGCPTDWVLTKF